ncbi:DUF3238 domain-containing protein [Paenibacillus wenxiniae]|uniref:DUF3238 domain-containing protein n=1 Tax=Paenibacillus wenxiniae TaxID=1636843 RepID=A0ABW4RLE3_9BACL
MAFSAAVKIQTFISEDWILFPFTNDRNYTLHFKGDHRSFTSSDNASFRTKQYLSFNYTSADGKFTFNGDEDTGTTELRKTNNRTGASSIVKGKASPSTITHEVTYRDEKRIQIKCVCDSSNPLVSVAPAINYTFNITLFMDGRVELEGNHDAFPCYEVYARANNGAWKPIYQFTETTIDKLAPPVDEFIYKIERLF